MKKKTFIEKTNLEFDLFWGISPKGSLKYKKREHVKAFWNNKIREREKGLVKEIKNWTKGRKIIKDKLREKLNSILGEGK